MKGFLTDPEDIVRVDHLAAAFNAERMLRDRKFLVDLACGHKAYTAAMHKARCLRCTEMLKRSLVGDADYQGFRFGDGADHMIWREDPCRQFNEPTDLEGNFLSDPLPLTESKPHD